MYLFAVHSMKKDIYLYLILRGNIMFNNLLCNEVSSISEFKKNPVRVTDHIMVAVLNHNKPCFYAVNPSRLDQLIRAENELNKLKEGLING